MEKRLESEEVSELLDLADEISAKRGGQVEDRFQVAALVLLAREVKKLRRQLAGGE